MRKIKIISGGQTGADQGALSGTSKFTERIFGRFFRSLDADSALNIIEHISMGGTAPKNFMTELGPNGLLGKQYHLVESQSSYYPVRTEQNVKDADGTLIIEWFFSRGCALTKKFCKQHNKPYLLNPKSIEELHDWIIENDITVLNVAGHRESSTKPKNRSIHGYTHNLIMQLLMYMYLGTRSQSTMDTFRFNCVVPFTKGELDDGETTTITETDGNKDGEW